ncbi:uncharacterized protein LOC129720460 [Wyeomyia smithii]|uniref:uncharacterized protein LOC129720460 n=1 Tax=Wyeomyia smithii TaxID=174621 RepID=UPI002467EA05|nr:uncharacterized protein LOC129720460 [Wyeomyia smithii]
MSSSRKLSKYKQQDIEQALEMVRRGVFVRYAAKVYGIPQSTLRDKINYKYPGNSSPGKSPILSQEEEAKIEKWAISVARAGFPVTKNQLRVSVAQYLKRSKKVTPFVRWCTRKKWMILFLKRHPSIKICKPSTMARYRATVKEEDVRDWFEKNESFLDSEGLKQLLECPDRIFNLDKTSFELVVRKRKCLGPKGMKRVYSVFGNNEKESYTALFTASAAGTLIPPLILFPYKCRIPFHVIRSVPLEWGIGRTESGWMTSNAFFDFLRNIFKPWLVKNNVELPIFLFVDGHKSHTTLQVADFCKQAGIILVCLYPNSTHITQPLDVGYFAPLKKQWEEQLLRFRSKNGMRPISKSEICPLIASTLKSFENIVNVIQSSFRGSGIYPWIPNAIKFSSLPSAVYTQPDSVKETVTTDNEQPFIEHNFLENFETFLTAEQKAEFERQIKSDSWHVPLEDKNLYQVWRYIRAKLHPDQQDERSSYSEDFLGFDDEDKNTTVLEGADIPTQLEDTSYTNTLADKINTGEEKDLVIDAKDCFDEVFVMPATENRGTRAKMATSLPSVATSEEFMAYMDAKEKKKQAAEELKVKKRIERRKRKLDKESLKKAKRTQTLKRKTPNKEAQFKKKTTVKSSRDNHL